MRAEQVKGLMEAYSHVYEAPEVLNEEVETEQLNEAPTPSSVFDFKSPQAKKAMSDVYAQRLDKTFQAGGGTKSLLSGGGLRGTFQRGLQRQGSGKPKTGGNGSSGGSGGQGASNSGGGGTNSGKPTASGVVLAKKGGVEGKLDKSTGKFTAGAFSGTEKSRYTKVAAKNAPTSPGSSQSTATSTPKPTTPAAPAKPAGSAMDQWAKANPKLAAAKAERDRTRGTSATTNPLMKDMKSSLPAPKSPSPSTASTAFGLAKKGVNLAAGVDIFDLVKGHLLDEGYADSEEGAMVIMVNMSEEWRKSILESYGVQLDEISKELALKAHAERATNEFETDGDDPRDFTKSGKSKADESERRIVKKHGEGARREANRAAEKRIYGHNKYSEAQEREQAKKKKMKEEYVDEAQRARENPEDHDKEEKRKYEPVRGERTPMPPRGDKRREEFEKWYAKQMGR